MKMEDADLRFLAREPPLAFFARFEAEKTANGKRLGILSSIIVADVIYGALKFDPILGIQSTASLEDQMKELSASVLGQRGETHDNIFPFLTGINSFTALLDFLKVELAFPASGQC